MTKVFNKHVKDESDGQQGVVNANRPIPVEEMAEMFGIDLDLYEVPDIRTTAGAGNFWTKAKWRLKEAEALGQAIHFEKLYQALKMSDFPAMPKGYDTISGRMGLIEVVDPHHGGLSWARETGSDWDLDISLEEHQIAHTHLLSKFDNDLERVVVRLGDDIFNFDRLVKGSGGATQRDTVQDIDTRWSKMYTSVCRLCVELLLMTADRFSHVDVVIIPGNHDYQTSFYLGKHLEARFHNDKRIRFDTRPRLRKSYRWGNTLLGFAHQALPKKRSLANKIKEEARRDYGETNYVEIHQGDEHHEEVMDEVSVITRKVRALCPNDAWHDEGGFASERGAQAFVYDKEEGLEEAYYYRTRSQAPSRPDRDLGPILGEK